MKKSIFILSLLLISILLSACSSLGATGKGTSPEIDFDGTIVSLGKTKLSELYDAGFEKSTIFLVSMILP